MTVYKSILPTAFVNREKEMEHIKKLFHDVIKGNGKFLIINGEEGVGKTALVNNLEGYFLNNNANFLNMSFATGKEYNPYTPFNILIENFEKYNSQQELHAGSDPGLTEPEQIKDDNIINLEMLYSIQNNHTLIQQKILSRIIEYASRKPLVIAIKDIHNASFH